jgi:small conductance mechanosensitive channel
MLNWAEIQVLLVDYLFKIILSLCVFTLALGAFKYVKITLGKILKKVGVLSELVTLILELVRFFYWVFLFAFIFNIFGFKEIAFVLGGSLAMVGLGLAKSVTSVASDLISGIFLIFDDDLNTGIQVKAGGIEGEIESIGIRKIKIVDNEGNLHVIPNKKVDDSIIMIITNDK